MFEDTSQFLAFVMFSVFTATMLAGAALRLAGLHAEGNIFLIGFSIWLFLIFLTILARFMK